jgi:hypothetical protein
VGTLRRTAMCPRAVARCVLPTPTVIPGRRLALNNVYDEAF